MSDGYQLEEGPVADVVILAVHEFRVGVGIFSKGDGTDRVCTLVLDGVGQVMGTDVRITNRMAFPLNDIPGLCAELLHMYDQTMRSLTDDAADGDTSADS